MQPNPTPNHQEQDPATPHLAILDELIALGTSLARHIHDAATRDEAPIPPDQATIAFERATRTVRRAILLASRLRNQPAYTDPAQPRIAARRRIIRSLENTITREANNPAAAHALQTEFYERLDAPDLEDEIATRPIAEIIQELCQDLGVAGIHGLPTPWNRRTPQDIAALNQRAATPPATRHQPASPRARAGVRAPPAPG